MKEENLIFIISQPRSGSTYLQNLLSNNKFVNTCSEPWVLLNFANQIKPELIDAKFDNKLALRAFEDYKSKLPSLNLTEVKKDFILNIYKPLLKNYTYVIDKTPRYWEIVNEIKALFPKSKIVILKRNPVEVARSMMITWDINGLKALAKHRRDLLLAPSIIADFCDLNRYNKNVYVVKYEKLIENNEIEIKKLYDWIGVGYTDEVLDVSKNQKYKGAFGDPYQNSVLGYKEAKKRSKRKALNEFQKCILNGYANFLGEEFLLNYGGYKFKQDGNKGHRLFSYFMDMDEKRHSDFSFKSEINYLLKQLFLRLFRII
ncbi:Sulfotransferase family protein [Zunongwangia mangrovi]|uniref:Sulfotransferase family protein n=1 Tax=Zunongwangia mangrovi TaxID=1334022 RepID=A0A1I1LLQ9_9FLAO|nr:sulfotransferase [Zunongwangia mangrovi]SFC73981.1 Sulfotransferase family protein [Zunongwangia mangrovi]